MDGHIVSRWLGVIQVEGGNSRKLIQAMTRGKLKGEK
jgi:hypothetical protein